MSETEMRDCGIDPTETVDVPAAVLAALACGCGCYVRRMRAATGVQKASLIVAIRKSSVIAGVRESGVIADRFGSRAADATQPGIGLTSLGG